MSAPTTDREAEELLLTIIDQVCRHPGMFVGSPARFDAVAHFIEGTGFGLWTARGEENAPLLLKGFQGWVAAKYGKQSGLAPNWGWASYLSLVFPDDSEAIRQLPVLFREYLLQRQP